MKIIYLSAIYLFFSVSISAQVLNWARTVGGTEADYGFSTVVDQSGNSYTIGTYKGSVDFDPGPGTTILESAFNGSTFILKLDSQGNFIWARSFGESQYSTKQAIQIDNFGNIYSAGFFHYPTDFDPGPDTFTVSAVGARDCFIHKMNADGNFVWVKTFGGAGTEQIYDMKIDESGNIYTTGRFLAAADFDPGLETYLLSPEGSSNLFIQKLDSLGNFVWVKSISSAVINNWPSISLDDFGGIFISCSFSGVVDFDPGINTTILGAQGQTNFFILKLDNTGNFIWAKAFGNHLYGELNGSVIDSDGNIYSTGFFDLIADFDPGSGEAMLYPEGETDIFIQKLDGQGNFLWATSIGSSNYDRANCIALDNLNNIYICGGFNAEVDFDPGPGYHLLTNEGNTDAFVQKLDSDGGFIWARAFGGIGIVNVNSILTTINEELLVTGYYGDLVDFDPSPLAVNHLSEGSHDAFVVKMNQPQCLPTYLVDQITACDEYTWSNGISYTQTTNSESVFIPGAEGCDTILVLDLTINSVSNSSFSVSGNTFVAYGNDANYQWLDCADEYAVIPGATDQIFTAMSNGSYALEITENGCTDTSVCFTITTVNLPEKSVNEALKIHPNPTTGRLHLTFEQPTQDVEFSLTDLHGKVIYSNFFDSVSEEVIIMEAEAGVYFLTVKTALGRSVSKIVKK